MIIQFGNTISDHSQFARHLNILVVKTFHIHGFLKFSNKSSLLLKYHLSYNQDILEEHELV